MAPEIPEPPHPPHKASSLPRWLEWTTAISALVISVCSIGIAVYNAGIESRLLKANSYPYVISGISDATLDGHKSILIELLNNGVGPADERSLRIKLGDQYAANVEDLIRKAMDPADVAEALKQLLPNEVHDNEPTRFIAAKEHGLIFRIDETPQNARYWELLDQSIATKHWKLEYCYCSVFEECWAVRNYDHKPVKACVRDEPHEFTPRGHYEHTPLPQS